MREADSDAANAWDRDGRQQSVRVDAQCVSCVGRGEGYGLTREDAIASIWKGFHVLDKSTNPVKCKCERCAAKEAGNVLAAM